MKLRQLPEDFVVQELSQVRPGRGRFALYQMQKRNLTTLDALRAVAQAWNLPRRAIHFGGLKDALAVTSQFITIEGGPRRGLRQDHLQLRYLGQFDRPFHASDIAGNRFRLVLRDLDQAADEGLPTAAQLLRRNGLANYFDDQRFWSVGRSGEFVAHAWVKRSYEQACRLALTDPTEADRPADQRERSAIAGNWGQWDRLLPQLATGERRAVVEYLAEHPADFRRAMTRIAHDQRSIYLAAFQSHLWNELLAALLRETCPSDMLVSRPLRAGQAWLYRELSDEQREWLSQLRVPLPSARLAIDDPHVDALLSQVLARFGLERRQIKLDYPRDTFFSKGDRAAIVFPQRWSHNIEEDELQPGQSKLVLQFELPRGSYATMLVKQLAVLINSMT